MHHFAVKSSESIKLPEQKLKNPIFKPFQVSKQCQQQLQTSKLEFAQAIRDQFSRIEQGSSSIRMSRVVPETPPSRSVGAIDNTDNSFEEESQNGFQI